MPHRWLQPTAPGLGWIPVRRTIVVLAANDADGLRPRGARRTAWIAAGFACLAIGTVGIVVPLLPTVDFYALAAFCFGRADGRLERWLLAHPRIGPLIRDWRAGRGMPRRAKRIALLSLSASCALSAALLPARLAWIPILVGVLVGAYLFTRPVRPEPGEQPADARAE